MSSRDYKKVAVRGAAILTGSYVAGTVIEATEQYNQLVLLINFTKGSLTTAEVKIEFSPDNSTFYQEVGTSYSAGTTTVKLNEYAFDTTGTYQIPVPIKARYIKISAKGTGTATSSSMTIDAIVGNAN